MHIHRMYYTYILHNKTYYLTADEIVLYSRQTNDSLSLMILWLHTG